MGGGEEGCSEGRKRTVQNEFSPAVFVAVLLSYQKTVSGQHSNTFSGLFDIQILQLIGNTF